MDSGAGRQTGLGVQRQTVHFPLDDVGVVGDGGQVESGRVFAPRRVQRLVERPLLSLGVDSF